MDRTTYKQMKANLADLIADIQSQQEKITAQVKANRPDDTLTQVTPEQEATLQSLEEESLARRLEACGLEPDTYWTEEEIQEAEAKTKAEQDTSNRLDRALARAVAKRQARAKVEADSKAWWAKRYGKQAGKPFTQVNSLPEAKRQWETLVRGFTDKGMNRRQAITRANAANPALRARYVALANGR